MDVGELIDYLKDKPRDAKIVTLASDSGSGYNEATEVCLAEMVHRSGYPGYEGDYAEKNEAGTKGKKVIKVIRIW